MKINIFQCIYFWPFGSQNSKFWEKTQIFWVAKNCDLGGGSIITYSCDFCVSFVKLKEDRTEHATSITMHFMCPFCLLLFKSWNNLHKQHLHLHKGPVQCSIKSCKELSKDFCADREHRQHCRYICKHCGKLFKNIDRFEIHRKVHK